MVRPLISIITVTYNAVETIEHTITSILSQTYTDFEYIIIDGNSTDGTIDVIQKYKKSLTHFISEQDKGIYDAMNKGLSLSNGQYIYFIGGDDILYNVDVLKQISIHLAPRTLELLVGDVKYSSGKKFRSEFSFKTKLNNTIHHQGSFYNRTLFNNFKYDINFSLIADYELNLILYTKRNALQFLFVHDFISLCADGGLSRKQIERANYETNAVRKKVLGSKAMF